jgi:hypothetical protein
MRRGVIPLVLACLALAACGSGTKLLRVTVPATGTQPTTSTATGTTSTPSTTSPTSPTIPTVATKNTTRVAGADPVTDAAAVALAVYPSAAPGTHPPAVVLAPVDSWQESLAAAVFMASPVRAPLLLSASDSVPAATTAALGQLAPTGAASLHQAQAIRVGDATAPSGLRTTDVGGSDPATVAAAIDRLQSSAAGSPSHDVVVASDSQPAYAMPAAGWAAESGDPILYVHGDDIPSATADALRRHRHPHIYVIGPPSAVSSTAARALGRFGTVKRVGADGAAANSVAFATYRDPACLNNQPCVHMPGTFGWALRSPGHGYTLVNVKRPLDAAAAAALSSSGSFGPELLVESPAALPNPVLQYFLNYATPGYTQEGPTAAVYNHAWVIGDTSAVSVPVQAETDSLLEAVPQR